MSIELKLSNDGSHTLYNAAIDEHYHSVHGAVTESLHVFIKSGFQQIKKERIAVFEVGFGTGLNALLTYIESVRNNIRVTYDSIELYPVEPQNYLQLNYPLLLQMDNNKVCEQLHLSPWNQPCKLDKHFTLTKIQANLADYELSGTYDVIYFDAFSPEKQPELWREAVFSKMFAAMNNGGILVTYCAKGVVRRTMQSCGFQVERIPGPPGKREMLRGRKP